jgi:hypothetical protein
MGGGAKRLGVGAQSTYGVKNNLQYAILKIGGTFITGLTAMAK